MITTTDHELLRRYVADGSETAFATLVERHLNLVYSVARRHLLSASLAEEVSQAVFIELARHAKSFNPRTPLVAWLHLVGRRKAIDIVRRESRRQLREQQAFEIAAMNSSPSEWSAVEPLLDEAVESLNEPERAAILLRYFENKSLREVGAALGTSEDTAQKRVSRAVDRLRGFFLRRGIAVSAAGLATDLSAHALHLAPTGLGATVASHAIATTVVGSAAVTAKFTELFVMTTFQKFAAWTALALAAGAALYEGAVIRAQDSALDLARQRQASLQSEMRALRRDAVAAEDRLANIERQIDERLARRSPTSSADDAALARQIEEWQAQLDRIKTWLAQRPDLTIPEFSLLSETDWFDVATQGTIASEAELRRATSQLRQRAEGGAAMRLIKALNAYIEAEGGRLPDRPHDLEPFCDPPLDRAVFDRYEMLHTGDAADLPATAYTPVLAVKKPADIEYDEYWRIGPRGYGSTPARSHNLSEAQRAFAAAHHGQRATSATLILPYLKWPVDETALQTMMDESAQARRR